MPNILISLTDDHDHDDTGLNAHYLEEVSKPRMDAQVEDGIFFSDLHQRARMLTNGRRVEAARRFSHCGQSFLEKCCPPPKQQNQRRESRKVEVRKKSQSNASTEPATVFMAYFDTTSICDSHHYLDLEQKQRRVETNLLPIDAVLCTLPCRNHHTNFSCPWKLQQLANTEWVHALHRTTVITKSA